jgi:hypothetical protein
MPVVHCTDDSTRTAFLYSLSRLKVLGGVELADEAGEK